jgi:hypothetical protein
MAPTGGDAAPPVALSITGRDRHSRQNVRHVKKKFSVGEPSRLTQVAARESWALPPAPLRPRFPATDSSSESMAQIGRMQGSSRCVPASRPSGGERRNVSRKARTASAAEW